MPKFVVGGEAVDGVEAVEMAQQLEPDLVILDFAIPEMHGLDAATAMRFILPRARIYLLTAHSSRDLELAVRNRGVDAVFSKYDNSSAMFKQGKPECISKVADKSQAKSASIERSPKTPLPTARASFIEPAWCLQAEPRQYPPRYQRGSWQSFRFFLLERSPNGC